ncbi:MAG: hypothetical protein AAGA97_09510 [Pseudomonadota bacterium]
MDIKPAARPVYLGTVLQWGDTLAVIVFNSGEVGQFSASRCRRRSEVMALLDHWRGFIPSNS